MFNDFYVAKYVDPFALLIAVIVLVLALAGFLIVRASQSRRKSEQTAYQEWLKSDAALEASDTSFAAYSASIAAAYRADSAPPREATATPLQLSPEEERVNAQAQQIREWQRAYEIANGSPPPPGATPAFLPVVPSYRTNTLAILALIFGIGGGLLGIIFGHVALGQIAKSGEAGRGLAIAGLIFGYGGIAVVVIFLLVSYNSTSHGML